MANFSTHLAVASVGGGLCATVALAGQAAPPNYMVALTLACAIGGILPDIDLEKAMPSRMLFTALAIVVAFASVFSLSRKFSILELWAIWLGVFALVRFAVFYAFHKRTRHRGVFHSLLAGAFFMALTAVVFDHVFGEPSALAWMTGLFVLIGFVIHLVLDEIYSVDIEGAAIKKSFGTALKIFDHHSLRASALMAVALAGVYFATPPTQEFVEIVKPPVFFAFLKNRLLPKDNNWFDLKSPKNTAALDGGQATAKAPSGGVR
jgi:hypothetical protein